ncbi:MAG: hypothetical protein QGG39_18930, partial [Candidatus Poribacteria bacterium]|nr:hypothetical protein [Candidatus Poribacteria bacterium]
MQPLMQPDWRRNRLGAHTIGAAERGAVRVLHSSPVECQVAGFSWIRFKVEVHFGGLALEKHH